MLINIAVRIYCACAKLIKRTLQNCNMKSHENKKVNETKNSQNYAHTGNEIAAECGRGSEGELLSKCVLVHV